MLSKKRDQNHQHGRRTYGATYGRYDESSLNAGILSQNGL